MPINTTRRARASMMLACVLAVVGAPPVHAQLLDRVEVVRRGNQAVIEARFTTSVRYVRHAPPDHGKLVQIEVDVTGTPDGPVRDATVTRRHPATSLVPAFLLTWAPRTSGLTVEFREEVSFQVGGGAGGRTIEIRLPIRNGAQQPAAPAPQKPAAPAVAAPRPMPPAAVQGPPAPLAVAPATSPEVEAEAARALAAARSALERRDLVAGIESLNRVLDLPPNRASEEAQALIGIAREDNGQPDKARVEYQLYLKLYPQGAEAARVRARLAALGTRPAQVRAAKPERSVYGSVSSHYYSGNTKFDATLQPTQPTLPGEQVSLTSRDQSALVTEVDFTAHARSASWEQRINFRDTYSANFLAGEPNENRLTSLYYEAFDRSRDILARAGRQSSPGVGVLGRFDGGWLRAALMPGLRVGAVAGRAVEFFPAPEKRFAGASVDFGPFKSALSGAVYAIEQRVDGFRDRRAAGVELRFLDPVANGFAQVDYDIGFRELNILLVQGNWNITPATSANLLFDRRRSPTLQLSNALFAYPGARSVGELVDSGISLDGLRADALAVTPVSELYSLGLTWRLNPRWQVGGDVKLQKISAASGAGALPATPGTGNIWICTFQGVGTSLWTATDVLAGSGSVIRSPNFDGWSVSGSYVVVLREAWRLEGQLRYYRQTEASGTKLSRLTPTAKLSYRLKENFTLEAETGIERSDTRASQQSDLAERRFYNLGFRWDFY